MSEFDWEGDESVVFPTSYAVAVYINDSGDVVIRQADPIGNDDSFVVIPPRQLKALIGALRNFQDC